MGQKVDRNSYTQSIFTPVYIEFVAGARSQQELDRYRAFLGEFFVLDQGRVLKADWVKARHLAQRVPRSGKNRDMGDCLIRAIADRLNCEILTLDKGFPV